MSKKIRVYFPDKNKKFHKRLINSLLYRRSVRIRPDGFAGVNISGEVFILYDNNFYNPEDSNTFRVEDCPIVSESQALTMLEDLPIFSDKAENKEHAHEQPTSILQPRVSEDKKDKFQLESLNNLIFEKPKEEKTLIKKDDTTSLYLNHLFFNEKNLSDFQPLTYEKDWFIGRSDWYVYVSFNGEERYEDIVKILSEPRDYCSLASWPGFIKNEVDSQNKIIRRLNNNSLKNKWKKEEYSYSNWFQINKEFGPFSNQDLIYFNGKLRINPINALSKTYNFEQIFGEVDFECRKSSQKSKNNKFYEYWIRFDLSISDEFIYQLFLDLFAVTETIKKHSLSLDDFYVPKLNLTNGFYTLQKVDYGAGIGTSLEPDHLFYKNEYGEILENYEAKNMGNWDFNHDRFLTIDEQNAMDAAAMEADLELMESEISANTAIEKETKTQIAGSIEINDNENEELLDIYLNENEELKKELANKNKDLELMKKELEVLQAKDFKKEKESYKFFESWEVMFDNLYLLQRGQKTLSKFYEETKFVARELKYLDNNQVNNFRKIKGSKNWFESSKISNGTDEQGRIYMCSLLDSKYKKAVLIGSKQIQKEDINYMLKNDPPRELN